MINRIVHYNDFVVVSGIVSGFSHPVILALIPTLFYDRIFGNPPVNIPVHIVDDDVVFQSLVDNYCFMEVDDD